MPGKKAAWKVAMNMMCAWTSADHHSNNDEHSVQALPLTPTLMTYQAQIDDQTMLKVYDDQACISALTDYDQAYKQDQRTLPMHLSTEHHGPLHQRLQLVLARLRKKPLFKTFSPRCGYPRESSCRYWNATTHAIPLYGYSILPPPWKYVIVV
jgi:hypothetical protein